MLKKGSIIVGLGISLAAIVLVVAQQSQDSPPAPAQPVADAPVDAKPAGGMKVYQIDRQTGELLTLEGKLVDDVPDANSEEAKHDRLLSVWAIEHPDEYAKMYPPADPPKPDPNIPQFDITQPEEYAAWVYAHETPADRQQRELASLAITNPAAYEKMLRDAGLFPPPVDPEDPFSDSPPPADSKQP